MGPLGGHHNIDQTSLYLDGEKFQALTVIRRCGRNWLFRCDCGNVVNRAMPDVITGEVKDCGCGIFGTPKWKNVVTAEARQKKTRAPGYYSVKNIPRVLKPGRLYRLKLVDNRTLKVRFEEEHNNVVYLHNPTFNDQSGIRPFLIREYGKEWWLYPLKETPQAVTLPKCPYNEGVQCGKRDCVHCGWYDPTIKATP